MDANLNERIKYVWNHMAPDTGRHMGKDLNIRKLNKFYDDYISNRKRYGTYFDCAEYRGRVRNNG